MSNHVIKNILCGPYVWIVVVSLFLGAWCSPLIVSNVEKMSRSIMTGKETKPVPMPLYGFWHPQSRMNRSEHFTFAVDFAGLYMIARHFGEPDLYQGKYDVMKRTVVFPPILFYMCNRLFCGISFPQAALCFIFLQVAILLISSFWILRYYRLGVLIVPTAVLYFFLLFLTPVGLTWFERGQFDIYPALSILFFMFAVYESKGYAFVLSAFFASLKWVAPLFFLQAFIAYLFLFHARRSWGYFGLFMGTILLTLIVFPYDLIYSYFQCLLEYQKISPLPSNISLINKIPSLVQSVLIILSSGAYVLALFQCKEKGIFFKTFLPYATGLLALNILMMSRPWEYKALCFLGFVPMIVPWAMKFTNSYVYRVVFLVAFGLFLMIVFRTYGLFMPLPIGAEVITTIYLAYFMGIVTLSVLFIRSKARVPA
ncbi:MAG: hypothetical protein HQL17_08495 [Candidatus Omnitrophica bacterium]|nr:hypothetical protein [Candidatus Omnitrophota bacterium]